MTSPVYQHPYPCPQCGQRITWVQWSRPKLLRECPGCGWGSVEARPGAREQRRDPPGEDSLF